VHVLTKIFIVLVSLLSVLLVPLVVVYAHNEDSFKAKYEAAAALAAAANQNLETEGITHAEERARVELQVRELSGENKTLAREREGAVTDVRRLEGDLSQARGQQAEIRADLATISSAVSAGQDLIESLLSEVRTMRSEALAAERRSVELDEALRDITGQLESAVAARRAVQEELQQLREEHARALGRVAVYVEKYGRVELEGGPLPPAITVDLDATVVSVRRGAEQTLAEINAGSRDGIQEGWIMTIGRSGNFLGNLRIIAVDINNATGIVELEDPNGRGKVEAGDRVYARRGRT
jgi:predicted  nucleic acid-binding Zn-ribbon protein